MSYKNRENLQFEYIKYSVLAGLSLLGIILITIWFSINPSQKIELRLSLIKNEILQKLAIQEVNIKGRFQSFQKLKTYIPGLWNKFRGADSSNISREKVRLKNKINQNKLPILWSIELGEGYAGAAVANGRVYVLDYDKKNHSDALRCFSLATGKELWRHSYRIMIKRNHGISRTVPAVTKKYVVSIGPKGQVLCLDAITGKFKWGIDLTVEFKTRIPMWYTGQCPLIDHNLAIVAPAGESLIIAIDCATGKIVWKTPNKHKWDMSHASIIPMTFYGKKMYVYSALGGIAGISAHGKDRGMILWENTKWNHSVVSPSPVKVSGNRIFITAGYGVGSMMLKINKKGKLFSSKILYKLTKEIFSSEQQTPIFYRGRLFGILPNDAGANRRQLASLHPNGKLVWTSGKKNRFGLGPYIIANGKIFVLDDNGVLTIARADINKFVKLSQTKIMDGNQAWAPMALANGRLILRDLNKMVCVDLLR